MWSNGDLIHKDSGVTPTDANATKVGYVAYLSNSDVDTSISGSRILVLSAVDVSTSAVWGNENDNHYDTAGRDDLKGYSNTSELVNCTNATEHSAAILAWSYDAPIPTGGATPAHWFLPACKQYEVMVRAFDPEAGIDNNHQTFPNFVANMDWTYAEYWTSSDVGSSVKINAIALSASDPHNLNYFLGGKNKTSSFRVRACFAY